MGRQGLPIPSQENLPPDQISERVPHQRSPPNKRASPQQPNRRQTHLPNPHPEELHLSIPHLSRSSTPPLLNLHHSLLKPLVTTASPPPRRNTPGSALRPRPRWSPSPKPGTACAFLPSRLRRIRASPHVREDLCVRIRRGSHARASLGTGCRTGVVGETGYVGSCYPRWWGEWNS